MYDTKLVYTPSPKLNEEEQKKAKEQYIANHYFIGAIMISGEDIVKVELRTPPLPAKKEEKKEEKKEDDAVTKA